MKLNIHFSSLIKRSAACLPAVFLFLSCQPSPQAGQIQAHDDNGRIFGGQVVTEKDLISRHVVGIKIVDPHGQNQVCTGIILSEKTILTAGHCGVFDKSQYEIIFDRDMEKPEEAVVQAQVEKVELHPKYLVRRQEIFDNKLWDEANQFDASVLHLVQPIPKNYKPIKWDFEKARQGEPETLQLAGFGAEFFDQLSGERKGLAQLKSVEVVKKESAQEDIIFFDQKEGKGACVGDSGGPSFFEKKNRLHFVGLLISVRNKGHAETCYGESRIVRLSALYAWLYEVHHSINQ